MTTFSSKIAIACSAGFLMALSVAAHADRGGGNPPPHRPPPEAFEACKNAKRGDSCTVKHGDHTLTGTCDAPPDASELACRPDGPPPPPPESLAACNGKQEGDACSFDHDGHAVAGTCAKGPHDDAQLGCRPDHPPQH